MGVDKAAMYFSPHGGPTSSSCGLIARIAAKTKPMEAPVKRPIAKRIIVSFFLGEPDQANSLGGPGSTSSSQYRNVHSYRTMDKQGRAISDPASLSPC